MRHRFLRYRSAVRQPSSPSDRRRGDGFAAPRPRGRVRAHVFLFSLPLLLALGGSADAGPFGSCRAPRFPVLSDPKGSGTVDVTVLDSQMLVHRSTNAQGIPSNGLIAVTERGLLLVDTAWTEPETEALLKWGDQRLGAPGSARSSPTITPTATAASARSSAGRFPSRRSI